MAVDHERAREILARVEDAWGARTLTRGAFVAAWHELERALGDGPERLEGMEGLILFAEPGWLVELGVTES